VADYLIDKYLGNHSVLSEQNGGEFLKGLLRTAENGGDVSMSLVKRIIHAYRSGQNYR